MGKEYFKCASSHLSSFTAGTFDNYKTEEKKKKSKAGVVVAVILVILMLTLDMFFTKKVSPFAYMLRYI